MATAASSKSAKKPKAMTKKNLQHFEKRLLEERKRVLKELGHYDETFGATPQGADGDLSATRSTWRIRAPTRWSARRRSCSRARKAGSSGTSTRRCAGSIAHRSRSASATSAAGDRFERLDALPHARYCIECKQREEDGKRKLIRPSSGAR